MQNKNEEMSDMAIRVEKLKTKKNLNQYNPNIKIMGGKENEVDNNQGSVLSQTRIHLKNTFHVNN